MSPAFTPPDLTGVTIVHQAGSGRATTHGGTYPLGGMDFTHAPSGRGVITFKAGAGAFQLSGSQADEIAPGHWRLKIDRTALLNAQPARGDCDLVMRPSPPAYVSLRCRVLIGGDPRPVTVEWSGDGSAAVRVR